MESVVSKIVQPRGYVMSVQSYREERSKIPPQEIEQHKGKWIAVSQDGKEIIASAKKISQLEKILVEKGVDPQDVVFENLAIEDSILGGSELN